MKDKGATLIEYALLMLIIITASLAVAHLGYDLREVYCDVNAGMAPTKQYTKENTSWSTTLNCCMSESDNAACKHFPPLPGGCPLPKSKACIN